jgi:hypothetical protein
MLKKRQGLSRREYGRHAGISAAYVSALVADAKIPTLPDGSLDAASCDAARARNTVQGRGQRRLQRQAARQGYPTGARNSFPECMGCRERYSVLDAKACGSPNAEKFCSQACAIDAAAGLTVAQIRRRVNREARA